MYFLNRKHNLKIFVPVRVCLKPCLNSFIASRDEKKKKKTKIIFTLENLLI